MIIQCESCKRKYRLDDSRINPPGSNVKCSKCGHIFYVSKAEKTLAQDEPKITESPIEENTLQVEQTAQETNIEFEAENTEAQNLIQPEQGQSEISQFEDESQGENEPDLNLVDIPTEHQIDIEEYIDNKTPEEEPPKPDEDLQSISNDDDKTDAFEKETEVEEFEVEDPAESIEDSPDLFDDQENEAEKDEIVNQEESSNIEFDEVFSENPTSEEDGDSTDDANPLTEDEDTVDKRKEPSRIKIKKTTPGFFARAIYTLITIVAIFVIFVASLVILIKAEILPPGTLKGITGIVNSVIPLGLEEKQVPVVVITEHNARWMNTRNGPVYVVSGLITNESQTPVHYVRLKSEYVAGEKTLYEDTVYAGNTFTDRELKASPMDNIQSKLDQKNGDIDVNNSRKLAGLNYNIQPGESIPFFTVFPAEGRVLGLRYNLQVVDYKKADTN